MNCMQLELPFRSSLKWALLIGSIGVATTAAYAQPAPAPNEVVLGPVHVPYVVQGVTVVPKVTSYLSVSTSPAAISIKARTYVDLRDLQAKIGSIIDTQPLPRDNCRSYSANNPVVTIHTKQLLLAGDAAAIRVAGDVDVWDCRENPIPNSKVEWRNDGPFGLSIPHIVTWPGSPIKNRLLQQPVSASLGAKLTVPSDTSLGPVMLQPQVDLGGQPGLVAVRDLVLNLFRVDVNALAERALRSAIDPNKLVVALPAEVQQMNLKITKASFVDVGGLGVELVAEGNVSSANLTDLLKAISNKPKP